LQGDKLVLRIERLLLADQLGIELGVPIAEISFEWGAFEDVTTITYNRYS
jgi:hypothetical protein